MQHLQLRRWWQKALAGAAGAIANEILRFYLVSIGTLVGPFLPNSTTIWQYIMASALYVSLAAVLTVLWDDPNPFKCLAVGAGLPKIIQALAQSSGTARASALVSHPSLFLPRPTFLPVSWINGV
jgi:hypothetical protein